MTRRELKALPRGSMIFRESDNRWLLLVKARDNTFLCVDSPNNYDIGEYFTQLDPKFLTDVTEKLLIIGFK